MSATQRGPVDRPDDGRSSEDRPSGAPTPPPVPVPPLRRRTEARTPVQDRSNLRQRAMVEAAARLLIAEGFPAVTHRRVAKAAGVPQGSASYYFPSSSSLVTAAVEAAEDLRGAAATERAEALPRRERSTTRTARLLIETFYAPSVDDSVVDVRLDPMLTAMRDPALRPIMRASRPRLLAALRTVLDASGYQHVTDVDLLGHFVDASLMSAASDGTEQVLDRATATTARLLEHWR
ncbi:TetR/AcrR family transcriptional regulator [Oerskovia enterophila]|uniref:HTH-type transcriptional regulator BetI n=1 Tax=Oerskovia enterophila TaxID=43678 RepID=A0A163RTM9_9CELL|nr:TetR family transcriptional regulator [Oerskovia enterophila]KZM35685.1 HTH-type transcriptional regulator BetI [Oerskovia enterophila]